MNSVNFVVDLKAPGQSQFSNYRDHHIRDRSRQSHLIDVDPWALASHSSFFPCLHCPRNGNSRIQAYSGPAGIIDTTATLKTLDIPLACGFGISIFLTLARSVPLISPLLQVTTNMLYFFRFASGTSLNMKKYQCTPKTRACSSEEARFSGLHSM